MLRQFFFFASCAGVVLLKTLEPNSFATTAGSIIPFEGENIFRLLVVVLPVLFAAVVFRGVVHGLSTIFHVLLGLLSAVSLWLILPLSISLSWFRQLQKIEIWKDATEFTTLVVAISLIAGLALLSISKAAGASHHGKKHH